MIQTKTVMYIKKFFSSTFIYIKQREFNLLPRVNPKSLLAFADKLLGHFYFDKSKIKLAKSILSGLRKLNNSIMLN